MKREKYATKNEMHRMSLTLHMFVDTKILDPDLQHLQLLLHQNFSGF